MIPGIDPKVDYAFKRLFGREQNAELLIKLLNAILDLPEGLRIVDLEILNPFHDKENVDDKQCILDVKARDQAGRLFNIEMQMLAYGAFCPRVLYYWARLYQGQLTEGMDYDKLRPTISICFVNTPVFPYLPPYHLIFELRERHHAVAFTDQLQVHILELSKFKLSSQELATPADPWLYFLCHGDELDTEALPSSLNLPEFQKALGELQMMTQSELEKERYEARLKLQRDISSGLTHAREEGLKRGLIKHVHSFQRVLQMPESPEDQLLTMETAALEGLAQQLEQEMIKKYVQGR